LDLRKRNSKNQESRVAKELSGKVTPASGALWGAKADVKSDLFLVECKTTSKDYYSLTYDTWYKIFREAVKEGLRIPVMCIDLNNGKSRYAVLRVDDTTVLPDISYEVLSEVKTTIFHLLNNVGKDINSVRVKGEHQFVLCRGKKIFEMVAIKWDDFLEKVVPEYEKGVK
jgi:hypothetical protein